MLTFRDLNRLEIFLDEWICCDEIILIIFSILIVLHGLNSLWEKVMIVGWFFIFLFLAKSFSFHQTWRWLSIETIIGCIEIMLMSLLKGMCWKCLPFHLLLPLYLLLYWYHLFFATFFLLKFLYFNLMKIFNFINFFFVIFDE